MALIQKSQKHTEDKGSCHSHAGNGPTAFINVISFNFFKVDIFIPVLQNSLVIRDIKYLTQDHTV